MTIMLPSLVHTMIPSSLKPPLSTKSLTTVAATATTPRSKHMYSKSMDDFMQELWTMFEKPLSTTNLLGMSTKLQREFSHNMQTSRQTMLPSYIHTLPTGTESGNYLSLDVGGSTFRVALVKLTGSAASDRHIDIMQMHTNPINDSIRALEGRAFFRWMATKINDLLASYDATMGHGLEALPMGLAWSFPVEQTSTRSGKLMAMGKAFHASRGLEGCDLADLIMDACRSQGLNVRMDAIVNDSSATLLSQAFFESSTRVALILGTGTNAAIHIPVSALHPNKLGARPAEWYTQAREVLINTEFSMCGKTMLPVTPWDEYLDAHHTCPGYQPYEHMLGGRYLGEVVRLLLIDSVRSCGLFGGVAPPSLLNAYALDTGTLAVVESDSTSSLSQTRDVLDSRHPLPNGHHYTTRDLQHVRACSRLVTRRAAALLAVAIHALWSLRNRADGCPASQAPKLTIACNGSVIERYPGFRTRTQALVNDLAVASGATSAAAVELEIAGESAIFGAAVAAACGATEVTTHSDSTAVNSYVYAGNMSVETTDAILTQA